MVPVWTDRTQRVSHSTEFGAGSLPKAFLPVVVVIMKEKPVRGSEQEELGLEVQTRVYWAV